MRPNSVTYRLTLFFSTLSTLVLLSVGALVGSLVEQHFVMQDLMELRGTTDLVAKVLGKVSYRSDLDQVPLLLQDALVGHPGISIRILGPEGRVLFATSDVRLPQDPPVELGEPAPGDGHAHSHAHAVVREHGGHMYRQSAAALPLGIAGIAPAQVLIAVNIDHERLFIAQFRWILWLSIAAGILLTAVMAWIAARRGLAPIRRIAALAQDMSASRLGERLVPDSVPPELADLVAALNAMLARLQDSFRRLSDFSSDIAHELRTPLANLVTETEVALSRARSTGEYKEVLYSNLEEFNRLSRMVGDMLFIAQADNGLIVPRRETVDLAQETEALFGFYDALADESEVSLARSGAGTITGDALMIRRALGNLLSNALRHTAPGGLVTVAVDRPEPGQVRIVVENPGEPIAPEQLSRLFDRFYRIDASRRQSGEGTGLGLSITRSIVAAHDGTISAACTGGRIRFELRFPAGS